MKKFVYVMPHLSLCVVYVRFASVWTVGWVSFIFRTEEFIHRTSVPDECEESSFMGLSPPEDNIYSAAQEIPKTRSFVPCSQEPATGPHPEPDETSS
jgi:hypothetical protein